MRRVGRYRAGDKKREAIRERGVGKFHGVR